MKSFIIAVAVLFIVTSAAFAQEKPRLEITHPVMKEGWVMKTGRGGVVDILTREGREVARYYVSDGIEMDKTAQLHGNRLWATINGKVYELGALSFVRQGHEFVVLWHEPVADLEEVKKAGLNRPGKPMALIPARNLVEVRIFLTKEEAEATVSKAE